MSNVTAVYDYPEDTTGTAVTNKIQGEQQIVLAANFSDYHFVVPRFAPLYAKGFTASLKTTSGEVKPLVLGKDFNFTHRFIDASLATAEDMFGSITFLDASLAGVLTLGYQTVGGVWTLDDAGWSKLMSDTVHNPRITAWDQVVNLPYAFPVANHSHPGDDLTGMGDIKDTLETINTTLSQQGNSDLSDHVNNTNNPHGTTAQQVGAFTRAQSIDGWTTADAAAIAAHIAAPDAHQQYLTAERANALIAVAIGAVRTPKNTTPAAGATNVSQTGTLQASAYYSLYGLAQSAAQFQVSRQQDFAANIVVDSGTIGVVSSYAIPSGLQANANYFWRCRYRDTEGVWSAWSTATSFSTGSIIVTQPSVTSPASGSVGVSTGALLQSSAFAVTGGADTHYSSDWEVWTGPNGTGTRVVNVQGSTSAKTQYQLQSGTLSPNITYYARVRHTGVGAGTSAWSNDSVFTTSGIVAQPAITAPANGDTNIMETPTLKSSTFLVQGGQDTHASSDWQVWTGHNGTGTKVYELLNSPTDKTSTTIPAGKLVSSTKYYVRTRQTGAALGASAWSPDVSFTTAVSFVPTIPGTPYQGGYYVGRMTQTDPATGTTAEYALVIAPKSSGESVRAIVDYPNASWSDGLGNLAKSQGDDASTWVKSLTIGGYSDWYVASVLEWGVVYRNLKPTNDLNYTGDGTNSITIPPSSKYSETVPAMTTNPLFQDGGTEQFADIYGTSTDQGSGVYVTLFTMRKLSQYNDWVDLPGATWSQPAGQTRTIRAVRRVKISS